jgi:uncharacterized membrane protein YeaQ/YmgE (transglycosylase-associated protein family)
MNRLKKASHLFGWLALLSSWEAGAFAQTRDSVRTATGMSDQSMSYFAWIVLGLIAGFIGSKIVNRRGEGIVLDILLGIIGSFAGGYLFHLFGAPGVSGLNLYSLFVAVIGSVVLLVIYHLLTRRPWYR